MDRRLSAHMGSTPPPFCHPSTSTSAVARGVEASAPLIIRQLWFHPADFHILSSIDTDFDAAAHVSFDLILRAGQLDLLQCGDLDYSTSQCGARPTRECAFPTCVNPAAARGRSSSQCMPTARPTTVSFSASRASTPTSSANSPRKGSGFASLHPSARWGYDPGASRGIRRGHTVVRLLGLRKGSYALPFSLERRSPPPLSTSLASCSLHQWRNQSRIRSTAAALPRVPFTTCMAVAMVDLIHERLQAAHPHRSDWPRTRPQLLRLLLEGDYGKFADYYDPFDHHWISQATWKDLPRAHTSPFPPPL